MGCFRILFLVGIVAGLSACGDQFKVRDYRNEVATNYKYQVDAEKPRYASPTVYYIPVYGNSQSRATCSARDMKNVKNDKGEILTKLCASEIKNCAMQGSCYYVDNTKISLLAYLKANPQAHKPQEGAYLFRVSQRNMTCPQGVGVKNICLDPYRNVAADPRYYSAGDVIFVPLLVGAVLPNGEVHDGYFIVRDQGGAIRGEDRFDFFIGFDDPYAEHVFKRRGLSEKKNMIEYYRALPEQTAQFQAEREFPFAPNAVTQFAFATLSKKASTQTASK